ncbi:hypothetical protein HYV70_00110 [Candidatus Uhrbacteria bacterium]|nr:hypothetical protein [Candidatus Uhrbacteria bacterium]
MRRLFEWDETQSLDNEARRTEAKEASEGKDPEQIRKINTEEPGLVSLFLKNAEAREVSRKQSLERGEKIEREEPQRIVHIKKYEPVEYTKEMIDGLLDDLRKVGPEKPLGYLPIRTLNEFGIRPEMLQEQLDRLDGVKTLMLSEEESRKAGGALYAYHESSLKKFLEENRQILIEIQWPTDPEEFIRSLKNTVPEKTALFDLIADAFCDKTNPGRRDVKAIYIDD